MNNKIAIIVPYFGALPSTFHAWEASALKNPMFEFWLFTDNNEVHSKQNIIVKQMAFSEFVSILQKNFEFKIECSSPYKICDYKPTYGDVFKKELVDYSYWGYCDIDLVLGDASKFITDEVLKRYDKINIDGHISIFKNNDKMNNLYRSQGKYPEYNFEEAFTTSDSCYFDEYRGMELKLIREKCSVFSEGLPYINVDPKKPFFYDYSGKQIIAVWDDGKLFSVDKDGNKREIFYIHICKRKMQLKNYKDLSSIEHMSIVPGMIKINDDEKEENLFKYASGGRAYSYVWLIERLEVQLKRYSLIKIMKLNIRRKQISKLRSNLLT